MPAMIRPGVPMHVQLRDLLVGQIERGALPPGTRIPAGRELATQHGVSPSTAARAVRLLVEGGFAETRGGRRGTFVLPRHENNGQQLGN